MDKETNTSWNDSKAAKAKYDSMLQLKKQTDLMKKIIDDYCKGVINKDDIKSML